ncbi:MAG: hypothetical protein ACD_11C00057G0024 [uncultured bacterium]|nr:MAG: hypothetical protein ACD_11C00057G0024 [uncultured bacterium]HBR71780.1 hypothetical protein [Candidatus Moranbacteria bacterium]
MQLKGPKNDSKYHWTEHSKFKMQFYGISSQRALRVIRSPHRTETGIVEKTVAVMQPTSIKRGKDGKENWGSEIWVMYQINRKIKIISVWRYPGVSPKNNPIPEDVLREIENIV